jgi:predicted RNase H-like HicB family nuclease
MTNTAIRVHNLGKQYRIGEGRKWMKKFIQVRIYRGDKQYVAECADLPVVSQGKTLDETAGNIREAIALHMEGENPAEWDIVPDFTILANFEIEPVHAKA